MPPSSSPRMPASQSVTRHILVVLVIAVFITAMALIILQNILGPNAPRALQGYRQGYEDGFRTARDAAQAIAPTRTGARSSLNGIVTAISGGTISFTAQQLLLDKDVDGVGTARTAIVGTGTTIVVMESLSDEAFAQAQQTFFTQLQNRGVDDAPPVPPSQYREIPGDLSDIAVGDMINVDGAEGEDLTLTERIAARRIVVMKSVTRE